MNKLLIAVMMMAGLTACSQEAKQETQETAQAVASEVKNEAASAADATASAAQEAADKVEAAASKAEEVTKPEEAAKPEEKAEAPAAEAKPAESAKVDGKAVFEANCKACHGGLIPGAPAVGKKEDWAPRIKQGKDTLHKHALEGFNSMPAKGGNSSLSDDEVKAAVDYMANESGAKF
ncbi:MULTISPECIES: c-type cytochrome [Neisseria]|uniref:Cytochrome c5 n=1 Tax=Neisseria mucosa C102 TaxID=435832 RepID=A0ABP2KAU0_NEIMU|nr:MULTISPECIES: c-type cytochrome [Neisseria]EFV80009.1 cytochrome c5 [Neisseria mucosa C102]OFM21667.1 cytochrome C [Neisseria sp. HMSC070A01]QKI22641.1 cytochrome c5 family protein [Neisseria mucosa]